MYEFNDDNFNESLWKKEHHRINIIRFLYLVTFVFGTLGLGLVLIAAYFLPPINTVINAIGYSTFFLFSIISITLSFIFQSYFNNLYVIWNILIARKIDQLMYIVFDGRYVFDKQKFGRQRLAIAALAYLAVEDAIEPLTKFSTLAPNSLKNFSSLAIDEITKRKQIGIAMIPPYMNINGEFLSFYDIEVQNFKMLISNYTPFYAIAVILIAVFTSDLILYPFISFRAIAFMLFSAVILIEIAIILFILKRKSDQVKVLKKTENIEALTQIAIRGTGYFFNYQSVITAIAALGDIGQLSSIPTLQVLLHSKRKPIVHRAAAMIDLIHVKNNLPNRFYLQL